MTTPKKTTTTKGRSTISKRTAVNEQALLDQLDDERIQSGDLWCKIQAIEFYRNLLAKQRDSIEDRDWWRFSAQVLRLSEVTALYDSLIARAARRRLANGNSFRNRPPELQEGDSCSDVLEFLYKSSIHRTRFVDALVQLLAQREQELQKTASQKAAPPSALEQKFAEIENLFDLSVQERQVVLFLYLSDCGYWDLGDVFSGGRFRDERKKLSNLATALGLSET